MDVGELEISVVRRLQSFSGSGFRVFFNTILRGLRVCSCFNGFNHLSLAQPNPLGQVIFTAAAFRASGFNILTFRLQGFRALGLRILVHLVPAAPAAAVSDGLMLMTVLLLLLLLVLWS